MKTTLCGTPVTESAYDEHVVSCPACRAIYVNNINLPLVCPRCDKSTELDANGICFPCNDFKDFLAT